MNHVIEFGEDSIKLYYSDKIYNPRYSCLDVPLIMAKMVSGYPVGAVHVLDLGCGSGFAGLVLKKLVPQTAVTFSDVDPEAIRITKLNAKRIGVVPRTKVADMLPDGTFHGVMANLPTFDDEDMANHTLHGPDVAYKAAPKDGLAMYRRLFKESKGRIALIVCECQPKYQKKLLNMAKKQGWRDIFSSGDAFAFIDTDNET